ncbi:GNAT family N-acetyltransferase [Inhella proteolytica]|uniref:GNAT family N-acetyltransferase n=1 Tax=Inhella proteolytica TaxID=2795029 RepID=A0A931J2F8_9BURK|nr:GNAT family N-acetyltransferase [Inhella proteolytica]MBH9578334.1 GNAT family N-acetyltransferase [Inhella proteolytica]
MPIALRAAHPQDAEAVAQVLCESRRVFLPFAPMAHPPDEVQAWIASALIPGGGVTIATRAGQAVAMLALSGDDPCRWINQLCVMPGHTGLGFGAQLLRFAHDTLPPPIRLYTFQANSGARRFYERHGYQAIASSDGAGNEERSPDVLYEWRGGGPG